MDVTRKNIVSVSISVKDLQAITKLEKGFL